MSLKKIIYLLLGCLSFGVGVMAAFIPGLPTTPFLLLAAWLFLRSSKRLHAKLLSNRFFGSYIREFQENSGMRKRTKIQAIGTMWVMICVSIFFMIDHMGIIIIVLMLGVIGTVVMGFIVPTSGGQN